LFAAPAPPEGDQPFAPTRGPPSVAPPPPPAAGNPFGAPPPPDAGNPFGAPAPATNSPFGAPATAGPPTGANPFGAPAPSEAAAADPFGGNNTFTPPPSDAAAPANDGPFSKIDNASNQDVVKWQVKKGKQSVESDLTLSDVRGMVRKGQLGPNDLAAPVGNALRLIAEEAILAVSLPRVSGSRGAAGASAVASSKRGLTLLLVVLVVGGGGYGAPFFASFFEKQSNAGVNPFRRALTEWQLEFPDVEGTSQEHVVEGRKFMRADTAAGYRQADEQFRQSLILDVSNLDAIAGYAENFAYLPNARADHEGLRLAQDGVEWGLRVNRKEALLLRAKGALFLANNESIKARATLRLAAAAAPNDGVTLLLQAQAALRNSPQDALRKSQRVTNLSPDLHVALLVTGTAHRRLGNFKLSRKFFDRRLKADPGNVATLKEYALLELDMGNGADAIKRLKKALSAEERDVEARLMLAKTAYQVVGDRRLAKKELKFILDNYSKVAGDNLLPTLTHAGYLQLLDNNTDEAKKLVIRALNIRPSYAPALYVLGRIHLQRGKLGEAIQQLSSAAEAIQSGEDGGSEGVVRCVLGDALLRNKEFQKALKNYARVTEYFPRYVRGFFAPAAAYISRGQSSQAATMMRRALDIDPHHDDDRRTITDYPFPRSDLNAYAKAYKAAKVKPGEVSLKQAAEGMIRFAAGQKAEAASLFKRTLKDDRFSHAALLYLAVMDVDAKRYGAAEKRLRSALRTTAGAHTITHLYLARAELGQKKYKDAKDRLEKVVDNESTLAAARYTLAVVLLKSGEKEKAMGLFREVVRNSGGFLPVKRTLASIEK
ncbi:MAG: tetratricopeptide repeat protein, partial [Deltaproteobacteria bacterium]|nr:tetratricopeptide repeat protein [Deltaproteobacteria bacterium]